MPWTTDIIHHLLGDKNAFLTRYCSALTRERLAGTDPSLVREVLERLADALPDAAHTTPAWSEEPYCIVAIGKPSFRWNKGSDCVTTKIASKYIGLGWDDQKNHLFLWADQGSAELSGVLDSDWYDWRTNNMGTGPRLRFGQPLTRKGDVNDPLAAGQPLHCMLGQLKPCITPSDPSKDKAEIIDQARVDIGELNEFVGQPRESLGVIYPRLASRASANVKEEGMGPGGGGTPPSPNSKGRRTHTRGSASRATSGGDAAVT